MNANSEKYLNTIDKRLKPLPASERLDIVREIKGAMIEMEHEGLTTEQILERLGDPKDLAKAYLGDLLTNKPGFSRNRFLTAFAFYGAVGFSGMFVIPCLAMAAAGCIVLGILAPVLGAIKMADYIFHLGLPYVGHIKIVLAGIMDLNPIGEFLGSLIIGILIYLAGRGAWKLLASYCKKASRAKRELSI